MKAQNKTLYRIFYRFYSLDSLNALYKSIKPMIRKTILNLQKKRIINSMPSISTISSSTVSLMKGRSSNSSGCSKYWNWIRISRPKSSTGSTMIRLQDSAAPRTMSILHARRHTAQRTPGLRHRPNCWPSTDSSTSRIRTGIYTIRSSAMSRRFLRARQ